MKQVHGLTGAGVHRCTGARVHRCTGAQVHRCFEPCTLTLPPEPHVSSSVPVRPAISAVIAAYGRLDHAGASIVTFSLQNKSGKACVHLQTTTRVDRRKGVCVLTGKRTSRGCVVGKARDRGPNHGTQFIVCEGHHATWRR